MSTPQPFEKRRIILGVTGGIAAYKSATLLRLLKVSGADVRVCMTRNAQQFITPLTLQALSGYSVLSDQFAPEQEDGMDHIELARWADTIIVAPASAHSIARFAQGMADDLLSALVMASEATKWFAPAMNRVMWQQPQLQHNLALLASYGWHQLPVASGSQACGEHGEGRMLGPEQILNHLQSFRSAHNSLRGVHVMITAGPTREAIDPVRFISNHSSGKMGYALAQAALQAGAQVTLISGPVTIQAPAVDHLVDVETAEEMYDAVMQRKETVDIFIASAAVVDYRPSEPQEQKIKKKDTVLQLAMEKTKDIVADFARTKRANQCVVGFAAETEKVLENARHKLIQKSLDMIVANTVGISGQGFHSDINQVTVVSKHNETLFPAMEKAQLAHKIIQAIQELSDTNKH